MEQRYARHPRERWENDGTRNVGRNGKKEKSETTCRPEAIVIPLRRSSCISSLAGVFSATSAANIAPSFAEPSIASRSQSLNEACGKNFTRRCKSRARPLAAVINSQIVLPPLLFRSAKRARSEEDSRVRGSIEFEKRASNR